jgi:hypothetical protein
MDNPVIDADGTKRWFNSNGDKHRDNGPAVEYTDGDRWWYLNGKCHREDGPAIDWGDGTKTWYLYDQRLSFDGWLEEVDISDEDKVMMKLQYG